MDPQPDKHTHDDADLHSFIQSGMGIALPALEMGIPHDHDGAEGGEGAFEEGDFRELMRDKQGDGEGKRMREAPEEGDDPRKRARTDASPVPTLDDRATPTHQEQEPLAPAPPADPAPLSSRPETAEERKARQREANRLAAGRSRGKKRDELAILEKTVQDIQEENNRLRGQLEALVSAAQPGVPREPMEDHLSRDVTPPTAQPPPRQDVPLGIEGLDLVALDGLRRELEAARREVTALEMRSGGAVVDDQMRTVALGEEREALVSLLRGLKKERDEVELERRVLEREVAARRVLLAGAEEVGGGVGKGEAGRDVGVERALIEVRSWLDNALTGWQKTGVLQPPASILDNLPNPPADPHPHPADTHDPLLDSAAEGYELDAFHGHEDGRAGTGELHHGSPGMMQHEHEGMLESLEGDELTELRAFY